MSNLKEASSGINGNSVSNAIPIEQVPLGEPAQFRMVLISLLAAAIGVLAGGVAFVLYKLIGLFTNLFFFHRWSTEFLSPGQHTLGVWVILVPVIGGIIVGF